MTTALILCGGLGTRLRPAVGNLPKALASIDGTPFIDYLLRYLARQSVRHVVLCTGYGAEQVAEACGDGSRWGIHIDTSAENEPLGTGGAVRNAHSVVTSDPFFVLNGDSFVSADLLAVQRAHVDRGAAITMVVTEVPDVSRFGCVVANADGSIARFVEKGPSGPGLINAGIYLMQRLVLDEIAANRPVSMERDVLPTYVGHGLYAFAAPGPFIDIGTPESLRMAPQILRRESLPCHGS